MKTWRPQQGPQAMLCNCPVHEIMYGGARGGGKTFGMILKNAIKAARYGEAQKGIFFRRELPQLEAAIDECKRVYLSTGWSWAEQKKIFTAPNGATLRFRPLERDADAEKYQGHDYTDLYFEEITNYPDPRPINRLRATLRSGAGVPCQFHATGNPGGPGHHWVKERWIDPAPAGFEVIKDELGLERIFIPAKVADNPALIDNDPGYVDRLKQVGSEALVSAWLQGNWDIVEGAFFDCWNQKMILQPFKIPEHWMRFRSFDWGSAAPFSVGWWAVVSDDHPVVEGFLLPRGALVRYQEWYGAKSANVGLKMTAEQVSTGIRARTSEPVAYSVADPAIFQEDGGPSIAERMFPVVFNRADNKRVAQRGQMGGWDQLRARMMGDGNPMIYCFNTCKDSIRTIPALQHDPNHPEDLDTSQEDHCGDEWRYAAMSRPWIRQLPQAPRMLDKWDHAFDGDQFTSNWRTV
jgi:hypothetical protein